MAENPNPPHNPTGRPSKEAASPPKKYVRGPDDEIYKRKREKKPPKPPDLSKDLQQMMYGFGDAQEVDAESVEMVERLVRQYIDEHAKCDDEVAQLEWLGPSVSSHYNDGLNCLGGG